MKRITQFVLCLVLSVSSYGQGVGGNSVPRTVSGISNALDLISSTQGTVFYRGASGWEALTPGTSGQLLSTQGAAANPIWVTATGGAGDMNGPASATDNAIVRFDGTGGKTVQNSAVTIADTTGSISINGTDTATAVNTGGLRSANFGLSTVSGGSSYFGGAVYTATSSRASTGFVDTAGTTGLLFNTTTNQFYSGGALITSIAPGGVSIGITTPSTGVGTGALQVAGGIYAGAANSFAGTQTVTDATEATTGGAGSVITAGGIRAEKKIVSMSNVTVQADSAALLTFIRNGTLTLGPDTSGTPALVVSNGITVGGAVNTGSATLSGAGAIPITTSLVKFTSTGGAQALTLANGTDGQRLTIVHDVDGGSGVLTPTTKTGFSTITFTNAGDTVDLVYVTTRGWMVTGSYLATIAP